MAITLFRSAPSYQLSVSFIQPTSVRFHCPFRSYLSLGKTSHQLRSYRLPKRTRPPLYCCASSVTNPSLSLVQNFFLNTNLERIPPSNLPCDARALLQVSTPQFRFLPIWQQQPLVHKSSEESKSLELLFWTPHQLSSWLDEIPSITTSPLTIPLSRSLVPNGLLYFAVDVSCAPEPPITDSTERVISLRRVLSLLPVEEHAALVAHATSLLSWHTCSKFCSRCGVSTITVQAGNARACPNPKCPTRNIYPRVMPSVLVLVTRSDRDALLLGRKPSWRPGRYSLLAGFAEIFESLEQTVVREVWEETRVKVDPRTIRYHSSQPWPSAPFASLMSGFSAEVTDVTATEVFVDQEELESAKWFERDWLTAHLDKDDDVFSIPGRTSLARRMITEWIQQPK